MKLHIREFARVVSAVVALAYGQTAFSQTTDTQVFEVIVPQLVSIDAPNGTVQIDTTGNESDTGYTFGNQTWTCTSNSASGAAVTMSAPRFDNNGDEVDTELTIAIQNPAAGSGWVTGTANHDTIATGTATVSASSTGAGDTEIVLTVDFLSGTYANLVSGTYSTTVTGTISANP